MDDKNTVKVNTITMTTSPTDILEARIEALESVVSNLTYQVNELGSTITNKQTSRDITVKTMQTYSRLLKAKLSDISTNRQTQEKVLTLIEMIEKKILEGVCNG